MKFNELKKVITEFSSAHKTGLICMGILAAGIIGMSILILTKTPPKEVERGETAMQVEAVIAEPGDYPVVITGYGEAGALNVVPISPEVSGKIVSVHPRLEDGEIIRTGELLFRIDPRNYRIASVTGRDRLNILKRNRELAEKEFQRIKKLYEKNRVGTISGVEAAEKAYLSAADNESLLSQAVETAEINLERCDVKAPFRGRLKQVSLEKGQYVSPGKPVLTLVDDSILEIHVPVDSGDARKWLRYDAKKRQGEWFTTISHVPCEIRWTENSEEQVWKGKLHRVVDVDRKTRTVTLAVRVARNRTDNPGAPLVDGMFCSVNIPGKTMKQVVRLPRWAVNFEHSVYVAVDNRLKTIPVTVIRTEGDYCFVTGGIRPGDMIIITRLVDPLENSLLNIVTLNGNKKGQS